MVSKAIPFLIHFPELIVEIVSDQFSHQLC